MDCVRITSVDCFGDLGQTSHFLLWALLTEFNSVFDGITKLSESKTSTLFWTHRKYGSIRRFTRWQTQQLLIQMGPWAMLIKPTLCILIAMVSLQNQLGFCHRTAQNSKKTAHYEDPRFYIILLWTNWPWMAESIRALPCPSPTFCSS